MRSAISPRPMSVPNPSPDVGMDPTPVRASADPVGRDGAHRPRDPAAADAAAADAAAWAAWGAPSAGESRPAGREVPPWAPAFGLTSPGLNAGRPSADAVQGRGPGSPEPGARPRSLAGSDHVQPLPLVAVQERSLSPPVASAVESGSPSGELTLSAPPAVSGSPASAARRARARYSGPCLRGSAYSLGLIVQYVPLDSPYHDPPDQSGSKGSWTASS
jgi:hypothetical protein